MRVCLLGGCGFIGSYVLDELLAQGHEVIIYGRQTERYRPRNTRVKYVFGELGNYKRLQTEALKGTDMVVHLASSTTPKSSNENPALDVENNLISTLWMLQACLEENIKRVIFLSSGGAVYGVPKQLPITETHTVSPISSYGIVKATIEKYLELFSNLYGLDYRVLRPANPYGPRQNPLGEQGIIGVYLWRILQHEPVVVFGSGEIVRDYFYVRDLGRAVVMALTHSGSSRIFNVGSGQGISINGLINTMEQSLNQKIVVERVAGRLFDVPRVVLDTTVIQQQMGWNPQTTLTDGLYQTWEWLIWLKQQEKLFGQSHSWAM